MAGPVAILRELHRLRRHARDLKTQIDRAPAALRAQQAKVARQEETFREAQDKLKRLKVNTLEKEGQLRSTHQLIAKHEKQLNESSSKKEYDALQTEIATERRKSQQLEDEILQTMAETEERTAQLPELEKAVERVRQEYAQFEQTQQSRLASYAEQLQQTQQQIKEVEATLPEDVRVQYDRLVAARGEEAMAAAENRTCSACYTELTAQSYNDLLADRLVFCKSCGRILYLPE